MKTGASEAERLRREIGGRRSRRGALPRALRERGQAFARARVAAGATPAMIAAEIGIAEKTAARWLRPEVSSALVPVRVVDVGLGPRTSVPAPVVTTPSGLRIEGLDLDALCALVVRCG